MRLGVQLLDDYLDVVAARCRTNTVLATAYDLMVFRVVDKAPEQVSTHRSRRDDPVPVGCPPVAYTDRPARQLAPAENNLSRLTLQLTQTQDRISALSREPAIRTLPAGRLETGHDTCVHNHEHEKEARARAVGAARDVPRPSHEHEHHRDLYRSGADHGISR